MRELTLIRDGASRGHRSKRGHVTQTGRTGTFPKNLQLDPKESQLIYLWVVGSLTMIRFGLGGHISCPADSEGRESQFAVKKKKGADPKSIRD